jgi:O-succinylbenzoate synthase
VNHRFQYRRYRLPFRGPVRTAHGLWTEREGVLVRLETEGSPAGYGEAAPLASFGSETVDEIVAACARLGEYVTTAQLAELPSRLGCLRNALAAAQAPKLGEERKYLGVAALLPAGRAVIDALKERADAGFRVFKWKVGVGDIADELVLLDDVCGALPSGAKLRLDANGAWDRRKAQRWLERCADRPVEFVEQPSFVPASEGATARGRSDDLLLGLASEYPTPIALDESVGRDGDVEKWLGAGWPGVYVVKASLLGDVAGVLERLAKAKAHVVFSSALETAVGARAALRAAFGWREPVRSAKETPPLALGFGVWPLFADKRFDGPFAAPFLRSEDVERINVEATWNALS